MNNYVYLRKKVQLLSWIFFFFGFCLRMAIEAEVPPNSLDGYFVQTTEESLVADAKLTESVWRDAPSLRFSLSQGDFAEVRLVCNRQFLLFGFWIMDTDIRNDHWDENAKGITWNDDSIEIYLDSLGDGGDKPRQDDYEIHFDTTPRYDIWGMPDNIWTEQGDGKGWMPVYKPEWSDFMPKIKRAFRILGGRPNDPTDVDQGYSWEILVPWDILPVKHGESQNQVMRWMLVVRDRDSDGEKIDHIANQPPDARTDAPSSWAKLVIPAVSISVTPKPADLLVSATNIAIDPGLSHLAAMGWNIIPLEDSLILMPEPGKPSLLYFRSTNAVICQRMEKDILSDPEVKNTLSSKGLFVIDITGSSQDHPLINKLNIYRVPDFFLLNDKGEILKQIDGYQEKKDFLDFLSLPFIK